MSACHVSVNSTSLKSHRRFNLIIVASRLMFTLVGMVTWVDVGGGCYRVVSKHGSTLGLDGQCVLVMHACQLHVCLLHLYTCCIFLMNDYGCSMVIMENLTLILWNTSVMSM